MRTRQTHFTDDQDRVRRIGPKNKAKPTKGSKYRKGVQSLKIPKKPDYIKRNPDTSRIHSFAKSKTEAERNLKHLKDAGKDGFIEPEKSLTTNHYTGDWIVWEKTIPKREKRYSKPITKRIGGYVYEAKNIQGTEELAKQKASHLRTQGYLTHISKEGKNWVVWTVGWENDKQKYDRAVTEINRHFAPETRKQFSEDQLVKMYFDGKSDFHLSGSRDIDKFDQKVNFNFPKNKVIVWDNQAEQWNKKYFTNKLNGRHIVITSTHTQTGEKRKKPFYKIEEITGHSKPSSGLSGVVHTKDTKIGYYDFNKAVEKANELNHRR